MSGLLALLALVGATAPQRPPLTVGEVWQQHVALDGQIIRVSGVVVRCQQLGCAIRESASREARSLGLGSSEKFDRDIQSRLGLPIVVEGRLDAMCLHSRADKLTGEHGRKGTVICTDRAPELRNPRIVSSR